MDGLDPAGVYFWTTAGTLDDALGALVRGYPVLKVHLVLCFHNEESTRWHAGLDRPVAAADVVTIIQAVSGGYNSLLRRWLSR